MNQKITKGIVAAFLLAVVSFAAIPTTFACCGGGYSGCYGYNYSSYNR